MITLPTYIVISNHISKLKDAVNSNSLQELTKLVYFSQLEVVAAVSKFEEAFGGKGPYYTLCFGDRELLCLRIDIFVTPAALQSMQSALMSMALWTTMDYKNVPEFRYLEDLFDLRLLKDTIVPGSSTQVSNQSIDRMVTTLFGQSPTGVLYLGINQSKTHVTRASVSIKYQKRGMPHGHFVMPLRCPTYLRATLPFIHCFAVLSNGPMPK
ncbi:uncharacterized protein MELLADRAFT_112598 [Melampsora larici-populina 98AG31]|uniref:Uncharacterized protein n=1 Tax=Melampsora larici-populina (strain 98AG31 / pathotype 3-4-7) TaxID=747676 RepID=F4S700_MELLP|nr:uncharacterized protein MELLADRAFT_112598 [Melampsora larici-populina 98AG31]EGF99547.1 hypothetical protein MELLADRAFT_112598 [Melampsora larici-populina 98AG31]